MKATMADIARMANVSKSAVSRVINNKPGGVSDGVRAKIPELIETAGYQPNPAARSLAAAKSNGLALILPDITNPPSSLLMRGVEDWRPMENERILLAPKLVVRNSTKGDD